MLPTGQKWAFLAPPPPPPDLGRLSLRNRFEFFHQILHGVPLGVGNCAEYSFVILGQILCCPRAKNGLFWPFWTLNPSQRKNYRSESLQIKFIGFVLTCRCATGPFFAHWADFDLTTGQKWAFLAVLDFESIAEKKLPVRITPNQVYWIRLDIYMCNGPLFCPLGRF